MDKISWLTQLADKQPEDPSTWYWLGKEYEAELRWLDAIGAYSRGLGESGGEDIRNSLLAGLAEATARLRIQTGGGAQPIPTASPTELAERTQPPELEERLPEPTASALTKVHPGLRVIDGGKATASERVEDEAVPTVTFEDVAGLTELKKTIQIKIISPFFNQGLFAKFRKKAGGGVLLYGPPGCGKTFIARATAGECKAKFLPVHITDILDPYIVVSEQNLKDMFDQARSRKTCIMFFDEIDAIGFNRAKSSVHLRGLVDTFLSEMEGVDTNTDQVLIMAATNMPWDVDNALKRPGRFDRMVFVSPPDEEARDLIFQLKLKGRYMEQVDTRRLAKKTEFFSGADVENVCERAAERVLMEILETGVERPIGMGDLEGAIGELQPSTLEWFRTVKNYVKYANQSGLYDDVEKYISKFGRKI
jgi:SpoVK/Ycf46/Vps4 family AAA+-type ATPase